MVVLSIQDLLYDDKIFFCRVVLVQELLQILQQIFFMGSTSYFILIATKSNEAHNDPLINLLACNVRRQI